MPARARLLVLGLFAICSAHAQEQDNTRRMLEQRVERQAIEREHALLKDELDVDRPTITMNGKSYTVEHNVSDVGRALYLSLQHKQWNTAQHFLKEYLSLPNRDPLLVHYARGVLARVQGHYREAEQEVRNLLELRPDFLLGRLELARVLFEDQQDHEAAHLFDAIAASIDTHDPKTAGVRKTVGIFQAALTGRRKWNGSFALGPAWSDNINRTSASYTCLVYIEDICFFDRKTPEAIASAGMDYDASVNRRLSLRGHHGLYFRSLLFGQSYRDNSTYNELTSSTQAGYSYRSGRHTVALAPSFDYYALGNAALYGAWGMHGEWSYTLSSASMLKLEGDWKEMRYRQTGYAANFDGPMRSAYATWFRSLGPRWVLFSGVDVVDSAATEKLNGYLQKGIRLGASLQWPEGIGSTLLASYRRREYGGYSALLEARRKDNEQNYILIIKASRFSFAGFTPLLTLRLNRVKSNVDWLYSYDKNSLSLKLEHSF